MSRIRADQITNSSASGAPTATNGLVVSGLVTATTGSFSGNVSVGGTLTYEDVSSVDSVGLITARTGVKVLAGGVDISGGGLEVTGITTFNDDIVGDNSTNISGINSVTATSFYGDGANLSGVESGVANFVASGAISNGAPVVINADGTVGVITGISTTTPTIGTPSIFQPSAAIYNASTYDSSNKKIVIAYRDDVNADYGRAVVGTVDGTSISFGTPVVFNSAATAHISATYDPDNEKVVITYRDDGNSNAGTAIVGTVSGTSISFGSATVFNSGNTIWQSSTYDTANNKVVIAYRDGGNLNYGTAIVGTVSGTSISFGTEVVFKSAASNYNSIIYDPDQEKVVISNAVGEAIVGTVSGTSISFGTAVSYEGGTTSWVSSTYDTANNKVVIAYRDDNNSFYGTAVVGTVSGTSISFGTPVVYESANAQYNSITYDSATQKVVIAYEDVGGSEYGTVALGTVSGTSISFDTPVVFQSSAITYTSAVYDPGNSKVVVGYNIGVGVGAAVVLSNISNNDDNFIGLAAEAISDGATGKINIAGGINASQTGLTTAQTYYVNPITAGLSTTTGAVVAGTSISSTEIIVR